MLYLVVNFILYSILVFGALDDHFSLGEILLICLKVVALALFLVDVLMLVVVFFVIRLSSSPQLEQERRGHHARPGGNRWTDTRGGDQPRCRPGIATRLATAEQRRAAG